MGFIKNIARKILQSEIEELKEECDKTKSWNNELLDKMSAFKYECESKTLKAQNEKNIAEQKIKELEKENEILRQYYDLDKEPSDEIKAKIHIDLKINRLKEEKYDLKNEVLRLTAICRPPVYIYQPYPYYGFGYRQF